MLAGRDTMLDSDSVREGLGKTVADDDVIFLRIQLPPSRDVRVWLSNRRWYLLESFARISMRQYSIRSIEDQMDHASKRIIASPLWPELCTLLEKYDRIEVSTTQPASGQISEWFHPVAGDEFLNLGQSSRASTRRILEELNVDSGMGCQSGGVLDCWHCHPSSRMMMPPTISTIPVSSSAVDRSRKVTAHPILVAA